MAPTTYVAEGGPIWHQWEERCLVLWRLVAPAKGDSRGVRQEWVGGWESNLLEAKGRGMRWGFAEGRLGKGIIFEV